MQPWRLRFAIFHRDAQPQVIAFRRMGHSDATMVPAARSSVHTNLPVAYNLGTRPASKPRCCTATAKALARRQKAASKNIIRADVNRQIAVPVYARTIPIAVRPPGTRGALLERWSIVPELKCAAREDIASKRAKRRAAKTLRVARLSVSRIQTVALSHGAKIVLQWLSRRA